MNPINTHLNIFPDTNVLVQCHAIDELDWSQLGNFQTFVLIITKPVIEEIDRQKNGRGRLAKRARLANGWLRELLSKDELERTTKKGQKILIRADDALKPLTSLSSDLDFGSADDRLVGIVAQYCQDNPSDVVMLLSHDTGPLITAKRLGVPRKLVPDDWLLPPESDEDQRKIKDLENALERYQRVWPKCEISCVGNADFKWVKHQPLTEEEIVLLMKMLCERYPLATDFSPRPIDATERMLLGGGGAGTFEPPLETEVAKYVNETYPAWLEKCKDFFCELHEKLDSQEDALLFSVDLQNTGGQPAKDVLVHFQVLGEKFGLVVPKDVETPEPDEYFGLHQPPSAPRGRWKYGSQKVGGAFEAMRQIRAASSMGLVSPYMHRPLPLPFVRADKDTNAFYWKGGRPSYPMVKIELTCAQWRHRDDAERFTYELDFEESDLPIRGAVEVQVHAENLVEPEIQRISVSVQVLEKNCWEQAVSYLQIEHRGLRLDRVT